MTSTATDVNPNKKRKELEPTRGEECLCDISTMKRQDLEKLLKERTEKLNLLENELKDAKERIQVLESKADTEPESEDDHNDDEDSNDPWQIKFNELRQYRIINGNCSVPKSSNKHLVFWIWAQKKAHKNKKLSQDRVTKLESLGLNWGKSYPDPVAWETGFDELSKLKRAMGHCNVPVSQTSPSQLAKWVSWQRNEYKRFQKGRDSLLTLEQIQQLNEIGFNWKGPRLN